MEDWLLSIGGRYWREDSPDHGIPSPKDAMEIPFFGNDWLTVPVLEKR